MKVKDSRLNIIQLIKNWCKKDMKKSKKVITINSVSDYILHIKSSGDKSYYFRGENSVYPRRIPGIYRSENPANKGEQFKYKKLLEVGTREYYYELFEELGRGISAIRGNRFEQLLELQHYGAITNILDVSNNPLVALFFACYGNDSNDGKVYVYSPLGDEKHYFGHTISIMTALNFIPRNDIDRFIVTFMELEEVIPQDSSMRQIFSRSFTIYDIISKLKDELSSDTKEANTEQFRKECFQLPFKKLNIKSVSGSVCIKRTEDEAKKQILDFLEKICPETIVQQYRDAGYTLKAYQDILLHNISEVCDKFLEQLNQNAGVRETLKYPYAIYEDIQRSYVVKTAKINERIKNQRGAFIVPGYVSTKDKKVGDIQGEINASIEKSIDIVQEVIIPQKVKSEILVQLKKIGIDEGFIYPDIKHIADAVLEKYQ
ncbi:TPA: FRG domain-containing protein [Streptococcus suis]